MAEFDWYGWTGAAGGSVIANYVGAKTKRIVGSISNSDLAKYAYIAWQITQLGLRGRANVAEMVDGASEWAVGDIVGGMLAKKLGVFTVVTPTATTPAAVVTTATTATTPGPVGVPASGGSGAFDLPIPGY